MKLFSFLRLQEIILNKGIHVIKVIGHSQTYTERFFHKGKNGGGYYSFFFSPYNWQSSLKQYSRYVGTRMSDLGVWALWIWTCQLERQESAQFLPHCGLFFPFTIPILPPTCPVLRNPSHLPPCSSFSCLFLLINPLYRGRPYSPRKEIHQTSAPNATPMLPPTPHPRTSFPLSRLPWQPVLSFALTNYPHLNMLS